MKQNHVSRLQKVFPQTSRLKKIMVIATSRKQKMTKKKQLEPLLSKCGFLRYRQFKSQREIKLCCYQRSKPFQKLVNQKPHPPGPYLNNLYTSYDALFRILISSRPKYEHATLKFHHIFLRSPTHTFIEVVISPLR